MTRAVESLGRTKIWSSPLVVSGTQSPASNSISHGHYGRITNIIQSPVVLLEFQKKISFWQEMITFRNTEMFWKVLYCVKDIYLISGSLFFDHFFLIWKWILCFNTLQEDDFFFFHIFFSDWNKRIPDWISGGEDEQAAGSVLVKDDGPLLSLGHTGGASKSLLWTSTGPTATSSPAGGRTRTSRPSLRLAGPDSAEFPLSHFSPALIYHFL